jgi:porin-like protein
MFYSLHDSAAQFVRKSRSLGARAVVLLVASGVAETAFLAPANAQVGGTAVGSAISSARAFAANVSARNCVDPATLRQLERQGQALVGELQELTQTSINHQQSNYTSELIGASTTVTDALNALAQKNCPHASGTTTNVSGTYTAINPNETFSANRAFIQFAGITAGIEESFFDFYSGTSFNSIQDDLRVEHTSTLKTNVVGESLNLGVGYTWGNFHVSGGVSVLPFFNGSGNFSERYFHLPMLDDSGSVNGFANVSGTATVADDLFKVNFVGNYWGSAGVLAAFNASQQSLNGEFSTGTNASILDVTTIQGRFGGYILLSSPYGVSLNISGYYAPWAQAKIDGLTSDNGDGWGMNGTLKVAELPGHSNWGLDLFGGFSDTCVPLAAMLSSERYSSTNLYGGIGIDAKFGGPASGTSGAMTWAPPNFGQ